MKLNKKELNLIRQWFNTIEDISNSEYLLIDDYELARKIYLYLNTRVPKHFPIFKQACDHKNKRGIDWPDGSYVEICNECGLSRNISEQDESDWIMVYDVEKQKELLLRKLMN